MILLGHIALDRRVHKQILHHSAIWNKSHASYMIAISWSLIKRDWWKGKEEETAKFFSIDWNAKSGEYVRYGAFIGRLAVVWQKRPKEETK